jgi:hypothetical protein
MCSSGCSVSSTEHCIVSGHLCFVAGCSNLQNGCVVLHLQLESRIQKV